MTVAQTKRSTSMRDLGSNMTDRVLSAAIQQGAPALVRVRGSDAKCSWSGMVVAGTTSHISIELDGADTVDLGSITQASLQITLQVDRATYKMVVSGAQVTPQGPETIIRVQRPPTITMEDRRQNPRRRLHNPTAVLLTSTDKSSSWRGHAVMLNLSVEGIACRIPEMDALSLQIDQELRVSFQLGEPPAPFDLGGRVTNITQGGTPNQAVIGLAFTADRNLEANRERLREVLDATD